MEFEKDTPITDEQRRMAQARHMTIPPLDPSVHPDEPTDDFKVAQHLRGPAPANAPNDIEQNTNSITPTPSLVSLTASKKAPSLRVVTSGTIAAIVFLTVIVVAILLYTLT